MSSCGGFVSFDPGTVSLTENSLEEGTSPFNFNETLFPLLSAHCANCHGESQSPLFAIQDDIIRSHDNLVSIGAVNFQIPSSSRIVTKVKGNHACWTDCDNDATALTNQITQWAARNGIVPPADTPKPKTQELVIPASLSSNPSPVFYMTFPLEGINGIPPNSFLDIAIYEIGGVAYQFGTIGIRSSVQLFIKKVDLQLNRKFTTPTYHVVNQVTQTNTTSAPGFVISTANTTIPSQSGKGIDTLRFVFDEIRPATQDEINNLVQFQRFVAMRDQIDSSPCGNCHFSEINYRDYTIPAFQTFSTPDQFKNIQQGTFADGTARYFVDPGNPTLSTLYRSVAHNINGNNFTDIARAMPIGASAAVRTPIANAIQAWIQNEPD